MTTSRSRMDDVARLSGLSRSTVDRVLNGRPGVRAETARKVEAALQALNYAPSSLYARQSLRGTTIHVVLMTGSNPFFTAIRQAALQIMRSARFADVDFKVIDHDPYAPETLVDALRGLGDGTRYLVTPGVDREDMARELERLTRAGCRVVTFLSDAPRMTRLGFVGQDSFAAGRTAARLMSGFVPPGPGKIAVLVGHLEYRHLLDRMAGFRQLMGIERADLDIVQPKSYGSSPAGVRATLAELQFHLERLRGLYLSGGGHPGIMEWLRERPRGQLCVIGHELHDPNRALLMQGHMQAIVAHDPEDVFRRAVELVLGLVGETATFAPIHVYLRDNLPALGGPAVAATTG